MILRTWEKTKQNTVYGKIKYNGDGCEAENISQHFASSLLLLNSESKSENIKTVRYVLLPRDFLVVSR